MEQITSRQNPLIARLRKLGGDRSLRRREGVFLCEGVKLAEEAVRWGAEIEVLVRARNFTLPFAPPAQARQVEVPEDLLRAVSTVDAPQGVLCLCRMPPLAPPERLEPGRERGIWCWTACRTRATWAPSGARPTPSGPPGCF